MARTSQLALTCCPTLHQQIGTSANFRIRIDLIFAATRTAISPSRTARTIALVQRSARGWLPSHCNPYSHDYRISGDSSQQPSGCRHYGYAARRPYPSRTSRALPGRLPVEDESGTREIRALHRLIQDPTWRISSKLAHTIQNKHVRNNVNAFNCLRFLRRACRAAREE